MTQPGYDPFSFGQVRLSSDAKQGAEAPGLEDSLFATSNSPAAADGRDTSWDPPPQFEEPVAPKVVEAPAAVASAKAVAAPVREAQAREPAVLSARDQHSVAPSEPSPRARAAHVAMRPEPPRAPGVSFVEAAAPAVAFLACESAAMWTWMSLDNPVLGALAALLGLGLSAFAWFAVRR